jgi:hypothetical protein
MFQTLSLFVLFVVSSEKNEKAHKYVEEVIKEEERMFDIIAISGSHTPQNTLRVPYQETNKH